MGCFSWMFADKANKKALNIGESAYLLYPDGSSIHEPCYEGYGRFDGRDVYDLVVDWNIVDIHPDLPKPPYHQGDAPEYWDLWEKAVINVLRAPGLSDELKNKIIADVMDAAIKDGSAAPYLRSEWKRHIGIHLACSDFQNSRLRYPIKIVTQPTPYKSVPASGADRNQGMGDWH